MHVHYLDVVKYLRPWVVKVQNEAYTLIREVPEAGGPTVSKYKRGIGIN